MKKKKKRTIRISPAMRERFDCDYVDQLDDATFKLFKEFIEAIYAQRFDRKKTSKTKKKSIDAENSRARSDVMYEWVRVYVTPEYFEDLVGSKILEKTVKTKPTKGRAEIERIYDDKGLKVTRYRAVKK